MNPLIQLKQTTSVFLVAIGLAWFAVSPALQAVSPAPDGGYGPPAYGTGNTAEGQNALLSLTTGAYNTAVGLLSLRSNTTTSLNTAIGAGALLANTADQNTATGAVALFHNTTGTQNTANGAFALFSNTTGNFNTANGVSALFSNTTGHSNTANGISALFGNTTGSFNTVVGNNALINNTTGTQNIVLGQGAAGNVTTANNVIVIGAEVLGANVSNTCFIGNIRGVQTQNTDTLPVLIDFNGQLGTTSSSERFKKDIATMENASEAILSLRPVTFHYKTDTKRTPQFGLIAEEVAKVNPALVLPDKEGKPYTVRYDAVNAMLLNEFLKEHRKVEQLTKDFESKIAQQQRQIEALTAGLQKVSAQVEMSRLAPRIVVNNQ